MNNDPLGNGFTLVEMLVAAGVFSVIIVISIGAMVVANDAFRKTSLYGGAMENVHVAFETMARNIRTGGEYSAPAPESSELSFRSSRGEPITYRLNAATHQVEISKNDGQFQPITAPEISIEALTFRLAGQDPLDTIQPRVTITMGGSTQIPGKSELDTAFNIQTTVSQRSFACANQSVPINFTDDGINVPSITLADRGSADFTLPQCWNLQSLTVDVDAGGVALGGGDAAIVFAIDTSDSMANVMDTGGQTRMEHAQESLGEFFALLRDTAPQTNIALINFPANWDSLEAAINTTAPECPGNFCPAGTSANLLTGIVNSYYPVGHTPTAAAITLATDLLNGRSEQEKVIILLSDGEPWPDYPDDTPPSYPQDPLDEAEVAKNAGITIITVSFVSYPSETEYSSQVSACLIKKMVAWSCETFTCNIPFDDGYQASSLCFENDIPSWPLCGDETQQYGYNWSLDGGDLTVIFQKIIQSLPLSGTVSLNTSAEPTPLQGVVSEDLPLDISGIACEPGAVQDLSLLLNLNGLLGNATLRNLTANLCQVN